jgi:hypothetical protein
MAGIIPSGAKGIFDRVIDQHARRAAESAHEASYSFGNPAGAWPERGRIRAKAAGRGASAKPARGAAQ